MYELEMHQREASAVTVPWFFENMPPSYFRQISPDLRFDHLRTIAAMKFADNPNQLTLRSADDKCWSFIRPGRRAGNTSAMLTQIPSQKTLSRYHGYTTLDGAMALDVFTFDESENLFEGTINSTEVSHIKKYIDGLTAGKLKTDEESLAPENFHLLQEDSLNEYLKQCTASYLTQSVPRRFCIQRKLFEDVKGTENIAIHIDQGEGLSRWLTICV
eukprot:UN31232